MLVLVSAEPVNICAALIAEIKQCENIIFSLYLTVEVESKYVRVRIQENSGSIPRNACVACET